MFVTVFSFPHSGNCIIILMLIRKWTKFIYSKIDIHFLNFLHFKNLEIKNKRILIVSFFFPLCLLFTFFEPKIYANVHWWTHIFILNYIPQCWKVFHNLDMMHQSLIGAGLEASPISPFNLSPHSYAEILLNRNQTVKIGRIWLDSGKCY